jgi:hypothetical protein
MVMQRQRPSVENAISMNSELRQTSPQSAARASARASVGGLWASAFVLSGLCLIALARLMGLTGGGPEAIAMASMRGEPAFAGKDGGVGMVAQAGVYTALISGGGNDDLLLVLDGRSEELLVYRPEGNQGVPQLVQRLNVPTLFTEARTRAEGRTPSTPGANPALKPQPANPLTR